MISNRLLAAALLAGAFVTTHAQSIGGGAFDPEAVKRVNESLAAPWKFKARRLTRAEVDALLARPESLILVDVRRPDEFIQYGSFPVFLSVQNKDLPSELAWIPKDRPIVTVSNHAQRAGAAADLLAAHGFKVIGATGAEEYEVQGGTSVAHLTPPPHAARAASAPNS